MENMEDDELERVGTKALVELVSRLRMKVEDEKQRADNLEDQLNAVRCEIDYLRRVIVGRAQYSSCSSQHMFTARSFVS
jgi:F0F1-type ATP synthase assembly protein I